MQLQQLKLEDLKTTTLNVRKKNKTKTSDLVPSIRSIGLIQPLLVRPNCEGYEVVAGQRRYHALHKLAEEGINDPVPCLVMKDGDDVKALEASLAENIARLPMDEIDQYKAFAKLVKSGLSISDIASQFGVTERLIKQRLAIANLITPILNVYQKGDISGETVRLLTMATKTQQKAWLALFYSDDEYAPHGYSLKNWLFGGVNIPTTNALFDIESYDGNIITDLFGDEQYFDAPEKFWSLQNQAIAKLKDQYLADGWSDVIVLDVGEHFPSYEYVDTTIEDGGKIYIATSHDGEVTCYEGLLSRQEIKRRDKTQDAENGNEVKASKPELTQAMQNYLALHKHSAVRTSLLGHTKFAVRLAVAQMIAGSPLWSVHADPQRANSEKIKDSLSSNKAQPIFEAERNHVRGLLGLDAVEDEPLTLRKSDGHSRYDVHEIFTKLLRLNDGEVSRILTFIVAESLVCDTTTVDALGHMLVVDMSEYWQADECCFSLLRDKQVINAILKEVAGKSVADARISQTAKAQKAVIANHVESKQEGDKPNWLPRYLQFPMKAYTKQGGIHAMDSWKAVKKLYA